IDAANAADDLAGNLVKSLQNARQMINELRAESVSLDLREKFFDDPVGLAGAQAAREFDKENPLPALPGAAPELMQRREEARAAAISLAEDNARRVQSLRERERAAADAARSSRGG